MKCKNTELPDAAGLEENLKKFSDEQSPHRFYFFLLQSNIIHRMGANKLNCSRMYDSQSMNSVSLMGLHLQITVGWMGLCLQGPSNTLA